MVDYAVIHIEVEQSRYTDGNVLADLKVQENSGHFRNFIRMSSEDFKLLSNPIGAKIQKNDTRMRKAVPGKERSQ
ncbi:hypothetical protein WN55_06621 [Dufourea novaeangliae]|uniref:Uncharacterized protein n=1 Tax=Dufourea novaeangliae TaxID=178035 RepID=A0A154PSV1_DUFNO|nr:hypothetical protein WN55_06621 [Dufourea novaeangliae]